MEPQDSPAQTEIDGLRSLGAGPSSPKLRRTGVTVVVGTEDITSLPADQGNLDAGLDALVLNVTVGAYLASPSPGTSAASR